MLQMIYELIILRKIFALILMIQSGPTFPHAMTAELSWHVKNWDLIELLFYKYMQHEFYKICVGSS